MKAGASPLPAEAHAEYVRSRDREKEQRHEHRKHQRAHHGRSRLHSTSNPDASEHAYRKHGGHEFEYGDKHGHHAAPASAAPSSPQSGFGGDYSQYYKQYVGGNNLMERSEDADELDMDQKESGSQAYRDDESDTTSHVTHREKVKMQLPPQQAQPQQPQGQQPQGQQAPPQQPPTQPSQTQPAHPSDPSVQSPFVPPTMPSQSMPPQINITSSERNTSVTHGSGSPEDRQGDKLVAVESQVLAEKHHKHEHHKHDKHEKEHEHKHVHKGGEQPEQPEQREQREQREQPEQPQQDWHPGDRGYGGEQPEQTEQEQQRWWRPPSESTSLVESSPAPTESAVASPASLEAMLPMDNSDSFGTVSVISLGVMFLMLAGVMVFGGRGRWGFKHASEHNTRAAAEGEEECAVTGAPVSHLSLDVAWVVVAFVVVAVSVSAARILPRPSHCCPRPHARSRWIRVKSRSSRLDPVAGHRTARIKACKSRNETEGSSKREKV